MKRNVFLLFVSFLGADAYAQQQWEFLGLGYEKINTIAVDPRDPDVVYVGSQSVYNDTFGLGGIFKSTNGGLTWDSVGVPASVSKIAIHPMNSDIVYAALNNGNLMRPGIAKSTDAGQSWLYADSGIILFFGDYFTGIAIDPQHPETLYCIQTSDFTGPGIFRSTNGGRYWDGISREVNGNVVIDPESTNIVYAGGWKSTDGGGSWFGNGLPSYFEVSVLEMDPHDPATLYAVDYPGGSPTQVAKTTNKGATWQLMSYDTMGIGGIHGLAFDPNTPNLWYAAAGAAAGNVSISSDGGIHWQLMDPPIQNPNSAIVTLAFAFNGDVLYAGAWGVNYAEGSGVYRYAFVTNVPTPIEAPSTIRLHQNYPNPFNSTTTIEYEIHRASFVSLRLYNILGEEIATLVHGAMSAGRHALRWDARGIPSGLYFARLQVGYVVQTRKLLLLR